MLQVALIQESFFFFFFLTKLSPSSEGTIVDFKAMTAAVGSCDSLSNPQAADGFASPLCNCRLVTDCYNSDRPNASMIKSSCYMHYASELWARFSRPSSFREYIKTPALLIMLI